MSRDYLAYVAMSGASASSVAVWASGLAMLVVTMKATFFAGASQTTAKFIVLLPSCASVSPLAHGRVPTAQPAA